MMSNLERIAEDNGKLVKLDGVPYQISVHENGYTVFRKRLVRSSDEMASQWAQETIANHG